jgi:hypothetical protein
MAAEQGMLRPFLILVSMSPGCRNQATLPAAFASAPMAWSARGGKMLMCLLPAVNDTIDLAPILIRCAHVGNVCEFGKVATSLGFTLVTEPFFGDPHKEAEMILFRRQAAPQRCDAPPRSPHPECARCR